MALMEWSKELETGIPVIDSQHRKIIDFINELDHASRTGNKAETDHVMEELLTYTITHFEFEEGLQEKAGYQFLKAHRRIHENFMLKLAGFRERAGKGEDIAPELLLLLKTWLVSHIKGEDRDYIESVKKITESSDQEVTGWLNSSVKRLFG